jgi:hypothetical protein
MGAVPSTPPGVDEGDEGSGRLVGEVGLLGHCVCGVLGAALTLFVLSLVYATAVAVAGVVPLLSTTFLVVGTLMVWVCVWLALETALGYARRPAAGG